MRKGMKSMVAIIDYDAGNIRSVEKALEALGARPVVTREPEVIEGADRVILPGVGSFGDAMGRLNQYGLPQLIRKTVSSGKPFLGICLGLQLLFEESQESPGVPGLGILKGKILKIREYSHDVPTGHDTIIIGLTDTEYEKLVYSNFESVIKFAQEKSKNVIDF